MKEEWKAIKTYKHDSTLHLKGDTIYVSNKGKVRLNDEELTYGHGLYVSRGELHIYGCRLKPNMHRLIYSLFNGKLYNNSNVHHIDYNHLNNSVDNLCQLPVVLHRKLHAHDINNYETRNKSYYNKLRVKYLESFRDEHITQTKEWLKNRVIEHKK